ncbi:Dynein intermediate chain 2, ciliary [Portunus trituberculatus]|uniref:Dynein intermediate chain 2, ciliary n=1 Tax=Portunus trituberculatus TaxID=210409 RepID=A0A5B7GLL3_PORTR|nr:Dynein intermediate chain 2, ciliary [Portunus trituberculatus]
MSPSAAPEVAAIEHLIQELDRQMTCGCSGPSSLPNLCFLGSPVVGIGTCVAFRPDDEKEMLVGVDTGAVFQCTTIDTIHALTRYPAHTGPVRQVLWNSYHSHVFVSCSVDWTVKVWIQFTLSPLIVLDLGGAVSGVAWSPFNSSVVVALSDEGRVHVYDLFLRRARPLCVQSLVQRRRASATCVCPSPRHPVLLVGGERCAFHYFPTHTIYI